MSSCCARLNVTTPKDLGGPEVLTVRTVPVPEPDSGEVLIAVHTAGVGSWDAEMRAGWSPEGRPRFPVILGSDGSGQIAAVGSRVRRLKRGDRVYAYSFAAPKGGFYAGYVAVAAEKAARIPKRLGPKEAGAIPTTGLTAPQGIEHLKLKRRESTIVHGASGGVGTLGLQFAKHRNLRFPLLSDFEPKGGIARTYDVYRKGEGVSERALFVIDREGMIRWSYVSPIGVNPGADGILEALEGLSQGRKP